MTESTSPRQYYLAQLLFWGGYVLMNLVFMASYYNQVSSLSMVIFLVLSVLLFSASHGLRALFNRFARDWSLIKVSLNLAWILPITAAVVQALLFAMISALITVASINTDGVQRYTIGAFMGYTMNTSIMLVLWSMFYLIRVEFRKRRETEIAHWRLQSEVKEAELQFLRSQINSHFLFNALNNLRSLIREDAERARAGLNDLAALLRGLLNVDSAKKVKLKDELEWVKGYLALEALQFENRLRTEFNIDEALLSQELPPLILQTLVENAIKHGIAARRDGGEVGIVAKQVSDKRWQLIVTNPAGERVDAHQGNGIGIKNTRQRLSIAYGDQASLTLQEGDVVTATLELPL